VRTVNFSHHTDKLLTCGMEKLMRIYDCNQPESEPTVIPGAASNIRCSAWLQHDNLLLISYLDKPGMRCAGGRRVGPARACRPCWHSCTRGSQQPGAAQGEAFADKSGLPRCAALG
jgi:hypothetical protein